MTIAVLFPALCAWGYDLNWKEFIILAWVNPKSAVMMGLSLSRWVGNVNVNFALKVTNTFPDTCNSLTQ